MEKENIKKEINNMKKQLDNFKKMDKNNIPKFGNKPADEFLKTYIKTLEEKLKSIK